MSASTSLLRAQRRVHLEIGVEAADRLVGQRDVVRADFAAERDAARARFAQNADAARGAEVLAMDRRAGRVRRGGRCAATMISSPIAGQPGRPSTVLHAAFVHHAFADEIVVLAMVHDDEAEHARIFERAAHDLVDSGCNGRRR